MVPTDPGTEWDLTPEEQAELDEVENEMADRAFRRDLWMAGAKPFLIISIIGLMVFFGFICYTWGYTDSTINRARQDLEQAEKDLQKLKKEILPPLLNARYSC